jgi:hypothetical protein
MCRDRESAKGNAPFIVFFIVAIKREGDSGFISNAALLASTTPFVCGLLRLCAVDSLR